MIGITTMGRHLLQVLLSCCLVFTASTGQAVERVTYYHNDALGSPVAATDAGGTLLWREEYQPYGTRIKREASSQDTAWYTGKQEESATGLSYFGARWYDPSMGRFMALDPAGFSADKVASFSKYAYANNNPYKYLDPDGNSPLDIGFLIADAIKLSIAINSGNPSAIESAAADLAGSAIGLISPVPGTGQLIKGARAGSKIAKGAAGGERAGKPFTRAGKAEVKAENTAANGGQTTCSTCGQPTVPARQSQAGVTPPRNETHVDHIVPKSKGGDGSPSNGQVLCRGCNLRKSDNR